MAGFWRQLVFRKKHAINKSKHLNSIIKSSASTQLNSFSISSRICGPCLISIATNWHLFASIAMIASRILLILGYWSILQPWRAWQDWLWQPQVLLLTLSYFISLCQSFSQLSLSFSFFSLVLSYSLSKVFSLSLFFSGLITPLPLSVKGFITFNFCFLFHHSCPTLCKRFPHSHFLFLFHHQRVPSCWHICKINVGTVYNGCVKMYSSLCATSV